MYPPVHTRPTQSFSYDRLNMLWDKYPQFHSMTTFSSLETLMEEHESYQKDFDELREEYESCQYDRFLVQLSWADLPYRYATKELLESASPLPMNSYVESFMSQFEDLDTDHQACFLFPESFVSQFFVVSEVCKRADIFHPIRNLFPDEEKLHYIAVFDKKNMDDILLMFHLLYTNASEEMYGGYSLYDYSLPWYQNHLCQDGVVLRSPYLFYHNPSKTVYVRRNIEHILESGYFSSELELFLNLTTVIMPLFHWWYEDIALYEERDGFRTDWRMERTKIRTKLTAEGIIKPKWKHELSLFRVVKELYPDTLYQYRPEWLGLQSLDLYIPSIQTGIEYQGIQHYFPVSFFGGEEALAQRQELDKIKKQLCVNNGVRLIEWPYSTEPTAENVKLFL